VALHEFKCPGCAGALQFEPGAQQLACPYCGLVVDVNTLAADADLDQAQQPEQLDLRWTGEVWNDEGMAVYACQSCAGEIVGDETLGAASCPFCGNPVVMTSKFSGALRPNAVLPFKLGKKDALAALEKHYTKKKLLPKVFKDKNHLDEVKGLYVPFWLYDADAGGSVTYNCTQTRTWSDSNYDYTETSHYRAEREGRLGFSGVPVDGSSAMDDALMDSIEPFDMAEAVDFKTAYLAGYFANRYDMDSQACLPRATERMYATAQDAFKSSVTGYRSVTPENASLHFMGGQVRYVLLPVWLLNTSWNGQKYTFAMNGQTGKLVGDLPMDKAACRKWFAGIFGIAAVLAELLLLLVTRR
jgi:DNA-directed RNA polymerase subunit RPC12/RpoP